jgi:hypothetical protein
MHDTATLDRLAEIVRRHPGQTPLRFVLELVDGRRVLLEADRDKIGWSQQFLAEVVELLGPGSVRAAVTIGTKRREEPARRGPPNRSGYQPA